jgi:hypothetical protein
VVAAMLSHKSQIRLRERIPANQLSLNRPDQRAILDLVKINADMGRLGGLIKMWLTTNADFASLSAQGLQRKLENTLALFSSAVPS